MVCEEYLDVINVVVRDAYFNTYPRKISANVYVKSLGRGHGVQPSYDEPWRQRVMEGAFKRMVDKDKILRGRNAEWELHPDFDAKRFFKVRDSAEWVSQIYSTVTSEQHRSRIALQSLEQFLNSDVDRISGRQLIKLFGWSAGEGYDRLQIPSNNVVKQEPAREPVNLTQIPTRAGAKRKRIVIDEDGSEAHTSSESGPSSPPSLQYSRSSFEPNKPLDPHEIIVEKPRQEISGATQSERTMLKTARQEIPASTQSDKTELQNLLNQHPWLINAPERIQEKSPQDSFELVVNEGTLKFKCHDCPKNLYKAIYPDHKICNFEAHLRTPLHRQNVNARLRGVAAVGGQASPGIHKPNIRTRVSDVGSDARRASLATYRQSLPSQLSGMSAGHASPATCRQDVTASLYATSLQGPPPTAGQGLRARNKSQQQEPPSRSPEPRSLIVIFPIAASSGRLPAKLSMSHDSRPQYCPVEASDPSPGMRESDDGVKRRRLDSEEHSYSTNPHTVKARACVAKLDPRTKKYEDAKANDKKMTKYHVENVVKRSEAYQRASPAEQAALEEEGRNEYMNARYGPCSEEANEDLLTQGRRKLGKDADSYEKSQGGYNKLTKEWGFPEEHSTSEANGAQSLENVDAQVETQHRDVARNQNNGSAAIPALLRATLRQGGEIESLQQENDGLRRQTSALEEGHMRNARLILAAEGKHVELADRIETLEEWSWSLQSLPPAEALPEDISGRFALLEKRSETQRRNFTAAHQLQVSTSQEISVLRTTSNRHNEALETFKHSTKREKEWRKYLDKLTKEHKVKIEQLEAKLRQEREDKQNFKMATEGRVDAMIKHHQKSSDTMMKKMTALESTVERQSAQIEMLMRSDVPTQKQMAHNAWMESKLLPVKAKTCSPKRGRSPPRGPAGWRG